MLGRDLPTTGSLSPHFLLFYDVTLRQEFSGASRSLVAQRKFPVAHQKKTEKLKDDSALVVLE
jgi:hypothetical protein